MRKFSLALLGLSFLALSACDSTTSSKDEFSVDDLFAAPTAAETSAVAQRWANQALLSSPAPEAGDSIRMVSRPNIFSNLPLLIDSIFPGKVDTVTIRSFTHSVDNFRQTAVLSAPSGKGNLPVVIFVHGGETGLDSLQMATALFMLGSLRDSVVLIASPLPGEPLNLPKLQRAGVGPNSPWLEDVRDVQGSVRAAARLYPRLLDTTKVLVSGYSRGGGVALLSAIRDPLFKACVSIAGPTDFLGSFVKTQAKRVLSGTPSDITGMRFLDSTLLTPAKNRTLPLDTARQLLLRRSAVHFAQRLPPTLLIHHLGDTTVPVTESNNLNARIHALGREHELVTIDGRLPTVLGALFTPHVSVPVQGAESFRSFVRKQLF